MRKRPKEYLTNLFRHAAMGTIMITAFYLAGFWVSQFAFNSQAAQQKMNLLLAPKSNAGLTYRINEVKTINLILKPKDLAKDISAFKVVFVEDGVLEIVGFGEPSGYPNTGAANDIVFTPVKVNSNTFTYVIMSATNNALPHAVRIPIQIRATKKGEGKLKINPLKSSVVGNIAGSEYEFGNVEEGNYKFK